MVHVKALAVRLVVSTAVSVEEVVRAATAARGATVAQAVLGQAASAVDRYAAWRRPLGSKKRPAIGMKLR